MAQINMSKTIFQPAFYVWLCLLLFHFDFANASKDRGLRKQREFLKWDVKEQLNNLGLSEHCKALEYPEAYYHSYVFLRKSQGRGLQNIPCAHTCAWMILSLEASACSSVLLISLPLVHKSLQCFCATGSYTFVGAELSHSPKLWPWVYKAL